MWKVFVALLWSRLWTEVRGDCKYRIISKPVVFFASTTDWWIHIKPAKIKSNIFPFFKICCWSHLRSVHTRRHVAGTNRFVCTGEFLWKSLSPQQNFVAATSRKKSNQTESVRLVAATNSAAATKIFTKILQYTRSDLALRRVASPCSCN